MYKEHGKVVLMMALEQGISTRDGKAWARQRFVIETDERYPRRVLLNLFGQDKITRADLQLGEFIDVEAEVEAHEYRGQWYNDIRVYDVKRQGRSYLRGEDTWRTGNQVNQSQTSQPQTHDQEPTLNAASPTSQQPTQAQALSEKDRQTAAALGLN